MDFKQAKINGQDILKNSSSGILYSFYDWRKLITSDESQNIDGVHGRNTSPTYARVRIITLEGVVDRLGNNEEQNNLRYLQDLFSLQGDGFELEKKELYIKDIYNKEWKLDVKIKEPLEILEGDENIIGSHYKWRVILESTSSPIYKSYEEIITSGEEGNFGGFNLDFEFGNDGFSFDEVNSILECNHFGNISSPIKIEITAKNIINSPLKISNLTNDTFFALDIDAENGDKIIIDTNNYSATKNNNNILSTRINGSVWQKVKGLTQFIVEDKDGGISSNDFDVKIYFNNSLL